VSWSCFKPGRSDGSADESDGTLGRQGGRWFSQKTEELEDPRQGKHLGRNRKDGINGSFLQPSEHRKRSERDPRDKPGMTADRQEG